jgi:hypothetical protein
MGINHDYNRVTCSYVEEKDSEQVVLPLNLVSELVAKFGQA